MAVGDALFKVSLSGSIFPFSEYARSSSYILSLCYRNTDCNDKLVSETTSPVVTRHADMIEIVCI